MYEQVSITFTCENGCQETIIGTLYAGINQSRMSKTELHTTCNDILSMIQKGEVFQRGDHPWDLIMSLVTEEWERIKICEAQQTPRSHDYWVKPSLDTLIHIDEEAKWTKKGDIRLDRRLQPTIEHVFFEKITLIQQSIYLVETIIHKLTLSET